MKTKQQSMSYFQRVTIQRALSDYAEKHGDDREAQRYIRRLLDEVRCAQRITLVNEVATKESIEAAQRGW